MAIVLSAFAYFSKGHREALLSLWSPGPLYTDAYLSVHYGDRHIHHSSAALKQAGTDRGREAKVHT